MTHHHDDTDFMSELEAATSLRPATPVVMLLGAIMALSMLAIAWAAIAPVEIVTRGQGQVVPTQEVQTVQSLEGGILAAILVREGEAVKKGQILMRLSDVQFSSEQRGTESKLLSLRARKARLEAEANGTAFSMPADIIEKSPQIAANEQSLYESRKRELSNSYAILDDRISKAGAEIGGARADVARLAESKRLLQQELEITRKMVAQQAAPKLEEIRLQRELSDISGQINSANERQRALNAEMGAAQKEKQAQAGKFRSEALGQLNQVETEMAGLKENLTSTQDRVARTDIKSPVDGVINSIALTTIGGVIEPAMKLAEIVPLADELKIVAKITPEDVAFIHTGQAAKVKITAYDAQKYGALEAKLTRIGASSMTDREGKAFFEVELRTDKNYMGTAASPLPITPGMVAEVEIITGERSVLEYLLKPLLRARDVAMTER